MGALASPLSRLQLGDISHADGGGAGVGTLDDDESNLANMASPRSVMSDEVSINSTSAAGPTLLQAAQVSLCCAPINWLEQAWNYVNVTLNGPTH